jgi:Xaa-Pro aminopeptidase
VCAVLLLVALTVITAAPQAQDPAPAPRVEAYQSRRARLAKAIGPDGVFIALSSEPARRNGDVDWPFRQEDNLLYLTGLEMPGTTLVLLPSEPERQEIVFTAKRDPTVERWTGRVPAHEEVTVSTGTREVAGTDDFDEFIDALLQGRPFGAADALGSGSYFLPPGAPNFLSAFRGGRASVWLILADRGRSSLTAEQQLASRLRARYPEINIRDATPLLVAMREIKDATELPLIQQAIDTTVDAQKAAMARVLSASRESEVQATIEYTFRNLGACCWAFPSVVASGRNATTLHYQANNDVIDREGLMLTDIGAEMAGYAADITRTYPADGTFSTEQRAIYDAVLTAQDAALALMRPGRRFIEVHDRALEIVGRELLKTGLVTLNSPAQTELYFFHGSGHQLGLQTHDVYDRTRAFEPGMVLTIEPGVYVRKEDVLASDVFRKLPLPEQEKVRAAATRYDGLGVRIEDDVLITGGDPLLLSAGAPRSAREIEAHMAAARRR